MWIVVTDGVSDVTITTEVFMNQHTNHGCGRCDLRDPVHEHFDHASSSMCFTKNGGMSAWEVTIAERNRGIGGLHPITR